MIAAAPLGPEERGHPFTDPGQIPSLYADQMRVARRSTALLEAKVSGHHVGAMIADLAASATPLPPGSLILDAGCGGGRSTRVLAQRFPRSRILATDSSAQMLQQARNHLAERLQPADAERVALLRGDFHRLPVAPGRCHLAVAMFCLYHSADPAAVIAEFARCLQTGGAAVLVTKDLRSYHELDTLMVSTGLDPQATTQPSLYESAHGQLLPGMAARSLRISGITRDRHVFRFRDSAHAAAYLVTVPKYRLRGAAGAPLTSPGDVAAELRRRRGNGPVITSSIITYVVAHREPP
jgi:ubiquinone/menaquinone biosynthesis C-methylase UbiE